MKNKIKPIFIILILGQFTFIYSQISSRIDSLHNSIKLSTSVDNTSSFLELSDYYIATIATNNRDIDSAQYYANKALELNGFNPDIANAYPLEHIEALYRLGKIENLRGNYDKAIAHIERVISLSEQQFYTKGVYSGNHEMGMILYNKEQYQKAIPYLEKAYATSKMLERYINIQVNTGADLSGVLFYNGDKYNGKAVLSECTALINNPEITKNTKGKYYLSLGVAFDFKGTRQKAIDNYKKALTLFEDVKNIEKQVPTLVNLGLSHKVMNDDKITAIQYYSKALDLAIPESEEYNDVLLHLGSVYRDLENHEKAEEYFLKSLEIIEKQNDLFDIGKAQGALASFYLRNVKDEAKALVYFDKAETNLLKFIEEEGEEGESVEVRLAYLGLYLFNDFLGNYKKALEYHKKYLAMEIKALDKENKYITEELEYALEAEKKDKEIIQLEATNTAQQAKAERQKYVIIIFLVGFVLTLVLLGFILYSAKNKKKAFRLINEKNNENKLLVREIHHRVKNNLQIILSLLNAQIDGHKDNRELKEALLESQNKIRSMAIIHKSLYQGNNFTKVCANSYINELIHNLNKSFENKSGDIKFEIDVDKKQIKMGLAIPLGLIVNELITNSHKYAFDDNTKENNIKISFKELDQPNRFQLIIQDNGVGLPEGFNINELSSYGIQLVQGLVDQLHGNIEINQDKGTTFQIYIEEPIAA